MCGIQASLWRKMLGATPNHYHCCSQKPMSPLEWLKALYGTFGAKYPTASLLVVTILGALIAFAIWTLAAHQYQRDVERVQQSTATHAEPPTPPKAGSASASGSKSPAVTGNDNTFIYDESSEPKRPKPKPPE